MGIKRMRRRISLLAEWDLGESLCNISLLVLTVSSH